MVQNRVIKVSVPDVVRGTYMHILGIKKVQFKILFGVEVGVGSKVTVLGLGHFYKQKKISGKMFCTGTFFGKFVIDVKLYKLIYLNHNLLLSRR